MLPLHSKDLMIESLRSKSTKGYKRKPAARTVSSGHDADLRRIDMDIVDEGRVSQTELILWR